MDRRDPYRILHVIPEADPDVIRAAYRVLARKLHPDTGAPADPVVARRMADLNWAYAQVRDATAREAHARARVAAAPATPTEPPTHGATYPGAERDPTLDVLDFGRYSGWALRDVARRDIEYLIWLRRHASGARFRPAIDRLVREKSAKRPTR
ncbi:MAG: J domain-containing protein [Candidatus Limnocylindria bacterium]